MRSYDFSTDVLHVSKDHLASIFMVKCLKNSLGQLDPNMKAVSSLETSSTTSPATLRHINGGYDLQRSTAAQL